MSLDLEIPHEKLQALTRELADVPSDVHVVLTVYGDTKQGVVARVAARAGKHWTFGAAVAWNQHDGVVAAGGVKVVF